MSLDWQPSQSEPIHLAVAVLAAVEWGLTGCPVPRGFLAIISEPEAPGGLCAAAGSTGLASLVTLEC